MVPSVWNPAMTRARDNRKPGLDLRGAAVRVVQRLADAGHLAYFAGGCVRDRLMGHEPADYDVATDARPQRIGELFDRVQSVGEAFGVMLVRVQRHSIQVATFRTDGVYSDGRHPDEVIFSDAEHDARRRDFTINGLFEDPLAGKILDYIGGRADLEARRIRAIGDPAARLREDRLRALRAVRFAARFDFAIDPDTAEAIRDQTEHLRGVSRERIGQELKRMLSDASRAVAARHLQDLGLDGAVLDEPHAEPALERLAGLPADAAYPTALGAWLLDRHGGEDRPDEERIDTARRWGSALLLSNAEQTALSRSLHVYLALGGPWARLGVAAQKRLAASPGFEEGLALLGASDEEGSTRVRDRVRELDETELAPPPLIDGTDLLALGLTPGPAFKRVLDAVYDAQLEGSVRDKPQALALAERVAAPGTGS